MGAGSGGGVGGAATEKRGVENPGIKNRGAMSGSRTTVTTDVVRLATAEIGAMRSAFVGAPLLEVDAGEAAEATTLGEQVSVTGGDRGTEGAT